MKTARVLIITIVLTMIGATLQAQQGRGRAQMPAPYPGDKIVPGNSQAPGGAGEDAKREQVQKKVEAVRMWRLTEALKLDEKTSTTLASFLSSIEQKRREVMKENVKTMRELRSALKAAKPDDRALKAGLDKIEKNQRDLIDLRGKEQNGIKDILTVEQQAGYLLFQQEFRREMRRMIAGARENGAQSPARGGPSGSPQIK